MIPTDMAFLDLVNRRLDHVKAYNSGRHYTNHVYYARKWVKDWEQLKCGEISTPTIESYLLKTADEISPYTANKELRCLRALFNFGFEPQRGWLTKNPTKGIKFFTVEKKAKHVPSKEDVFESSLRRTQTPRITYGQ